MFSRVLSLTLVALLLPAVASADPESTSDAENAPEVPNFSKKEHPRSSWVWVDPIKDLAPDAVAASNISKIIYINRCVGGCTITPGNNDARANTSSIVSSTSNLSEFNQSIDVFNQVVDCVKDVYSPYDVEIVTEDPGPDVFHHMAVLAGTPDEMVGLQLPPGGGQIGGIAPSSCEPLNNVISFSFANGYIGGSVLDMCWTVAQESAHSFGLPNHVFNCLDPMTYLDGCGKKFFRNQGFPCGEFQQRPCNCSGATQNSHVELRAVFGDGTPPPPPELQLLLPKPGDAVSDGFTVFFDSTDPRLVQHSELWINGTKYQDIPAKSVGSNGFQESNYDTTTPALPDGKMTVEIKSYNDLGSESVASVEVTKGAPCTSKDSCFDFQECNDGYCEYPPASQELGQSCDVDQQCTEGVCAEVSGDKGCAVGCNPTVSGACVEGFSCTANNTGGFVCWPKSESGGCCSVAGNKREPMPWFASALFLLGFLFLRRKRY